MTAARATRRGQAPEAIRGSPPVHQERCDRHQAGGLLGERGDGDQSVEAETLRAASPQPQCRREDREYEAVVDEDTEGCEHVQQGHRVPQKGSLARPASSQPLARRQGSVSEHELFFRPVFPRVFVIGEAGNGLFFHPWPDITHSIG